MSGQNGFGGGFPAMGAPEMVPGGMPGVAPGAPAAMGASANFVLDIPADPTWQPFETTDTLEKDGYYAASIRREAARNDSSKSQGVFLTLEILDADARGKTLSKFLPDPRGNQKNVWFVWRGLFLSISGNIQQAQSAMRYTPGMLHGQVCYFKTEPFMDDGVRRTSVANFITKAQYDDAVAKGNTRWASEVKAGALPGALGGGGGVPAGLPTGFPGAGYPGLPGGPTPGGQVVSGMAQPTMTPQPPGAPMVQQVPMVQQAAPQQVFQAPQGQQFQQPGVPQQQVQQPPSNFGGFGAPPPVQQPGAQPTTPQPTAPAGGFPGFPQR